MANTAQEYDSVIRYMPRYFYKKNARLRDGLADFTTNFPDGSDIHQSQPHSLYRRKRHLLKYTKGLVPEFIGIVNYALMGLIQLEQKTRS